MKRYTFQVTKDVEILAVDELDAHAGLILGDYESETTKKIEFLFKSSEDFFADQTLVQSPLCDEATAYGADKTEQRGPEQAEQDCETEPCDECVAYQEGYEDGFNEGRVEERMRVHEALIASVTSPVN